MKRLETIRLLMECDAGCKMAVSSIDDVSKKVKEDGLKKLLMENKALHKELESEVEGLLNDCGATEKAPAAVAKGMSWLKTNTKLLFNRSDNAVADILTDGCNMGIKSLYRYLNQYKAADKKAKRLCEQIIDAEEQLRRDLRYHL